MAELLLTQPEIESLTGFVLKSKQVQELRRLGIEHRVRSDGMPLVSRRAFERAMGGDLDNTEQAWQPDFSAIQ